MYAGSTPTVTIHGVPSTPHCTARTHMHIGITPPLLVSCNSVGMASFAYQQGLGEILKGYAAGIDEGLVSVLSAIGVSSGAIGEHLK